MEKGWVKMHRTIMDKPIWTEATAEQKVLLMTLVMMAAYDKRQWDWKGTQYVLQPGQLITSLPSLVQKCGKDVTVQKIRTALKRFERYGFLTNESTRQNRLITIVNWDVYQQGEGLATDDSTDGQQTYNRQITSNKNVKNVKKEKKERNEYMTQGNEWRGRQVTQLPKRVEEFVFDLTKGEDWGYSG